MSNIPKLRITDKGIEAPDYTEVLDGTLEDINQAFDGAMNKNITTPQGQIAVSMSYSVDDKNNDFIYLAQQFNPDFASGRFQDAIGKIYFLEREAATGTTVTATCTGLVGTVIPRKSYAQDDAGYLYYSVNEAVIPASGSVDIIFVNENTGSIACYAGSLNKIYKAVEGWDSVYNHSSGALGQDEESRNNFEYRRRNSVALNSKNQNGSILANVLAVEGVIDAYVYSNDTSKPITCGATNYTIDQHSLCISVYGGESAEIAKAIWEKKNPGCGFSGNTRVVVHDKDGYSEPYPQYEIIYLIPRPVNTKFKVTLQYDDNLPSDIESEIKASIISLFTGKSGKNRARIGGRVHAGKYYADVSNLSEYVVLNSMLVSKDGINFSNSIEFGIDEIPVIDEADIEVIIDDDR